MLRDRQYDIKSKGFNMIENGVSDKAEDMRDFLDFSKMKVGLRTVGDATIDVGSYKRINRNYGDKNYVLDAMYRRDYETLRKISAYFYDSSGIYYRLCRYMAFLYRYDWFVTPFMVDVDKVNKNKILNDFAKVLSYLDSSNVKKVCGDIALEIMKSGVYYGCMVDFGDKFAIQ